MYAVNHVVLVCTEFLNNCSDSNTQISSCRILRKFSHRYHFHNHNYFKKPYEIAKCNIGCTDNEENGETKVLHVVIFADCTYVFVKDVRNQADRS